MAIKHFLELWTEQDIVLDYQFVALRINADVEKRFAMMQGNEGT